MVRGGERMDHLLMRIYEGWSILGVILLVILIVAIIVFVVRVARG
jgi:ABC-type dipeptide/oligopeptide/nickel transport system permease subunit